MDRYVYEWKDMYMNKKICIWIDKYVFSWIDKHVYGWIEWIDIYYLDLKFD